MISGSLREGEKGERVKRDGQSGAGIVLDE